MAEIPSQMKIAIEVKILHWATGVGGGGQGKLIVGGGGPVKRFRRNCKFAKMLNC